jgi:cell division topological specificity factor
MMTRLLDMLRGRTAKHSAQDAKDRLQFILFHDRIDLTPDQLDAMKREILEVISKYVSVEQERVDIALQQRQRDSLIVAEIPFSVTPEPSLPDPDEATEAFQPLDADDTGPVITPD